jgi:hypothetical protein
VPLARLLLALRLVSQPAPPPGALPAVLRKAKWLRMKCKIDVRVVT